MIVVRIEEWPRGDEHEATEIGRLEVGDVDGYADDPVGDYLPTEQVAVL